MNYRVEQHSIETRVLKAALLVVLAERSSFVDGCGHTFRRRLAVPYPMAMATTSARVRSRVASVLRFDRALQCDERLMDVAQLSLEVVHQRNGGGSGPTSRPSLAKRAHAHRFVERLGLALWLEG